MTLERDKPWFAQRLGVASWLDGQFSAADLMMVSVLLR